MKPPRLCLRGFTLLEVLLAIVLMSLFLVVLYDSYSGASRIVARCQTGYAPIRSGMMAQKILSRVLASASATKQPNTKAVFTGDESRLEFTTLNRQSVDVEHPWTLAFVRIAHDRDEGLSILTHPTYFLLDKDDPSKGIRRSFPMVKKLRILYWDDSDWVREWEATKKGRLPSRVRIELVLQGEGSPPQQWNFETSLPIQADLPIAGGSVPRIPLGMERPPPGLTPGGGPRPPPQPSDQSGAAIPRTIRRRSPLDTDRTPLMDLQPDRFPESHGGDRVG